MRKLHMNSIGFAALGETLLRNNRAQRSTSKRIISLASTSDNKVSYKKASPELLKKISAHLIRENKKRQQKIILIASVIIIMMIWMISIIV